MTSPHIYIYFWKLGLTICGAIRTKRCLTIANISGQFWKLGTQLMNAIGTKRCHAIPIFLGNSRKFNTIGEHVLDKTLPRNWDKTSPRNSKHFWAILEVVPQ